MVIQLAKLVGVSWVSFTAAAHLPEADAAATLTLREVADGAATFTTPPLTRGAALCVLTMKGG